VTGIVTVKKDLSAERTTVSEIPSIQQMTVAKKILAMLTPV